MLVLGIDTSCDDTCIAVYDAKRNRILSNIVSSQHKFHLPFGGIVPEIAARKHAENIDFVFREALEKANADIKDIDLVTVTRTPGLLPALLVGLTFAKGIAFNLRIPIKGVNHIEAHVFSPFIGSQPPEKFLALVVSGGHTLLIMVEGIGKYRILGKTLDDAVGEAYDKVGKMLGLGYPGGPKIDRLFKEYSGDFLKLPKPSVPGLNFSFSGLKTAVRRLIEKGYPPEQVAVSFQKTAIEYLIDKLTKAIRDYNVKHVAVSGGVSANSLLREKLSALQETCTVHLPPLQYTCDNGAMVAYIGFKRFLLEGEDSLLLNATARTAGI